MKFKKGVSSSIAYKKKYVEMKPLKLLNISYELHPKYRQNQVIEPAKK
jgi:hypothetical protein